MTIKLATAILFVESLLIGQAPPLPSSQIGRPDSSGEVIDGGGATLTTTSVEEFINAVAKENERRIREAKTALSQAPDRDFKAFVQLVIEDRQKLAGEISGLATRKNVRVALPAANESRQPIRFDRNAFLELLISRHQRYIRAFEEVAKSHSDSEARAFAATHLGSFRKHEQEARRILASSKGDKR